MKCPKCNSKLKRIKVSVEGAHSKALSYQCPKGDYIEYDKVSSDRVLKELKGITLGPRHKIVKPSKGPLKIPIPNKKTHLS